MKHPPHYSVPARSRGLKPAYKGRMEGRLIPACLAGALFLALALPTAYGWGREGHVIVARIAEDHLTSQAKAGIAALLGAQSSIAGDAVANWADDIRPHRRESKTWHYVNIPFGADHYDAKRDCPPAGCVVDRIGHFARVLADKKAGQETRVEALKFLVHFVGDVHQPLHCIERDNDRGGNECTVIFFHEVRNLHWIWDDELIRRRMHLYPDPIAFADRLDKRITATQTAEFTKGDAASWAGESHRAAREVAYAGVPTTRIKPPLAEDYVRHCGPVAENLLMKAGLRLARMLNTAFEGEHSR